MSFSLMTNHLFEINTNPGGAANYATIAVGIKNVAPANNESLAQDAYLDGNGFGSTDVIGAQLILAFTGDRDYADPAQNYVVGLLLNLGASRKTDFRWTEPNGGKFTGSCTIANISGPTGDAGSKGEISFEVHFNGRPTYTGPSADTTKPTVTTVVPANNATAIATTTTVVWTFNEALDGAYVNDGNFMIQKADGTIVAGTVSINAGKTQVTFTPSAALTAATVYTTSVSKNIRDAAGNTMAANYGSKFTTA
jgi:hypothetical protein